MARTKIKTLIIEDSGFMRIFITDMLRHSNDIEVVSTAINGLDGVEKARYLKPDVVITDMIMPDYDGLYVVRQLMKDSPLPIILLSSLDRADPKIFDALNEGAFDFIDKPKDQSQTEKGYPELLRLIREASLTDYLKLRKKVRGRNTNTHTFAPSLSYDILAIGASTGGPSALELLIANLPSNLAIPVVIAQHMPERFIESFASRLADSTHHHISVARDGDVLLPNHIYLAPGTSNVKVVRSTSGMAIEYVDTKYKEYNEPSIDCLLESVGEAYGARCIGVVLTGMGKDGAVGLGKIKTKGGLTIAQDEASCVVYGMPKAAYESGAATHQVSLSEISNFIISAL